MEPLAACCEEVQAVPEAPRTEVITSGQQLSLLQWDNFRLQVGLTNFGMFLLQTFGFVLALSLSLSLTVSVFLQSCEHTVLYVILIRRFTSLAGP